MTDQRTRYFLRYEENIQYGRDYYDSHSQVFCDASKKWYYANRQKKRAQMIAHRLIPLKDSCEICDGIYRLMRHHKDYGKPLEVLTLCKICHEALEVIEPPICSIHPEIRFYKGYEAVEILDSTTNNKRGQKWPCRILATGEIKNIVVGSLCYIPHRIKKKRRNKNE